MNRQRSFVAAMVVSCAVPLVFMAGQPRFGYLDPQMAKYVGVGLTLVAGVLWSAFGIACGSRDTD